MVDLQKLRWQWLVAAEAYYLRPGDDTGMADHAWDAAAQLLYRNRAQFPNCPILNDPQYEGGSLFWVKRAMYAEARASSTLPVANPPHPNAK